MKTCKAPEHGGNVYAAGRQNGASVGSFLDYSANINPLGLASSVKRAIIQAVDQVIHYPDADCAALKAALSSFYGVPEICVTPGNGAVELLYILCNVLRPERVLIPAPSFGEYERAARAAKAEVHYVYLQPADDFSIQINELITHIPGKRMVFLGNPNNPTGTLLKRRDIAALLAAAREEQAYVVVDESFLDFLPDDSDYTCRPLLSEYHNLIIIHSLTKFYAIPGLRLGFALTNAQLADELQLSKDPWNVNSLAQVAGVAALHDKEYQRSSRELVNTAKMQMYDSVREIAGLTPFAPSVNFLLVNIAGTRLTAAQLRRRLMAKGILIRDCSNYPGLSAEYVRLAVKLPKQNRKLMEVLKQEVGV
jgi:threonine-phosphate decarboxylase